MDITSSELYNLFDTDGSHIMTFLEWLVATYHLPQHLKVLDVGCGTGRLLLRMAEQQWQVVGLEPDKTTIKWHKHSVQDMITFP